MSSCPVLRLPGLSTHSNWQIALPAMSQARWSCSQSAVGPILRDSPSPNQCSLPDLGAGGRVVRKVATHTARQLGQKSEQPVSDCRSASIERLKMRRVAVEFEGEAPPVNPTGLIQNMRRGDLAG